MRGARDWERGCSMVVGFGGCYRHESATSPKDPWQPETSQAVRVHLKKKKLEYPRTRQARKLLVKACTCAS